MNTIEKITAEFSFASTGWCIEVETHCGLGVTRDEIEAIADEAARRVEGDASRIAEFMKIWEYEDFWVDAELDDEPEEERVYVLHWVREDRQGSFNMGDYASEEAAWEAVSDARDELLAQCGEDFQKVEIDQGTWAVERK